MTADSRWSARAAAGSFQVLIAGAGPAGLVAGIVLSRYGIRVLLVEKRDVTSRLSRALVISTRCMEILRVWGLEDQVRAGAADVEPRAWVTRVLSSDDGVEMRVGYPTAAEAALVSPTRPAWAPQDHLEPLLLGLLRAEPTATLRFGTELVALCEADGYVRADLLDRRSGEVEQVRADYVIGADGAHSTVRERLAIGMDGRDDLAEYQRVEFRGPLSGVIGRPGYGLYVLTHPEVACVLAPRGRGDRWGLSREWHPGQRRLGEYGNEGLLQLIHVAIGGPALPVELERTTAFSFAAQIAEHYRRGRCFLAGDAAHRMTPRGGTGMNTAIQDAYDVGWKLAWVLLGWAGPGLLDSYETERRPVGLHNVLRTGQPDGASRGAEDALRWDLNGRLAHHWVQREGGRISTLELLGPGLTLFTAGNDSDWNRAKRDAQTPIPVDVLRLDRNTTTALGLQPRGAILVRPDAHEVARWAEPNDLGLRAFTLT